MCSWLNGDSQFLSVDSRHFHLSSKSSCREVEKEVIAQIVSVAHKGIVWLFCYKYLNITIYAIPCACISLSRNGKHHSVLNTSRNLNLYNLFAFHNSRSMTVVALVLYDKSLASTIRAWNGCLHHSKERALRADCVPSAMTSITGLWLCRALSSCTVTVRTLYVLAHLELLRNTSSHLLKSKADLQTKVRTTMGCRFAMTTASIESSAENILEASSSVSSAEVESPTENRVQDIVDVKAIETASSEASAHLWTVKSKLVVLLAFCIVREHAVSLCCLFELLFCVFLLLLTLSALAVRVVFDGHFLVGLLYFICRGALLDTQHFIVITLCHT